MQIVNDYGPISIKKVRGKARGPMNNNPPRDFLRSMS